MHLNQRSSRKQEFDRGYRPQSEHPIPALSEFHRWRQELYSSFQVELISCHSLQRLSCAAAQLLKQWHGQEILLITIIITIVNVIVIINSSRNSLLQSNHQTYRSKKKKFRFMKAKQRLRAQLTQPQLGTVTRNHRLSMLSFDHQEVVVAKKSKTKLKDFVSWVITFSF